MTVTIRMTRRLYEEVRADLSRPHAFAAERVGFLFGRLSPAGDAASLILIAGYVPLEDDRYIDDPRSGARIDSHAIRSAMQGVLDRREGVFHVHMHDFPGRPHFSWMDRDELPRLIPSFQAVGPGFAHGLFLLGEDDCAAEVWLPGRNQAIEVDRITIVGFPTQLVAGGE